MKIGHPADKPLPAPAAGTPAAPAEAAAKATAGVRATGAATRRRQRDGRPVEHRVDAALGRRLGRVRRRQGRPDLPPSSPTASFKVNPEAIADKLIANAQELLAKVQG